MPDLLASIHINNILGLVILLVLWIGLFESAHVLMTVLRREPLIGWAVGPLGVTVMFLHEPSVLFIWFDVLGPAMISGGVLYIGLFTSLSPVTFPDQSFIRIVVMACGVLITSMGDVINALRDLRHPLWGEARVLRSMQFLRSTCAKIHFTPFGHSYLLDHFGANPTELLQAL